MKKSTSKKLVDAKLKIEAASALDRHQIGYQARALVLATLPHKKTAENFYKRSNGSFNLELSQNTAKVGLPYGSIPRLLLAYMATEAVKSQSREIQLGNNLSQFMKKLGLIPTGGRWGSITALKDQVRRLAYCSMTLTQTVLNEDSGAITENFSNLNIASGGSFHWAKNPDQKDLWASTVTLSEGFYEEIINHPIPLDLEILKALRRSPLALDVYSWLTYRTSYQRGSSRPIPWQSLQAQFGSDYADNATGKRDFKKNFLKALKKVQFLYEGANTTVVDNGLMIRQGKPSVSKRIAK
tara:strand:- start:700 stop:1590 length:891 start_codon:yes stop_codon:yes gene_type:complete